MLIVVGGMIGLGKTTVSEVLAEAFNSQVLYESVDDNPILPLFYTATEAEIAAKRYPFLLQLHFLNSRFHSIKLALENPYHIIDRSIYEDWYFAKVNKDLNKISEMEFNIYEDLLNNMLEEITNFPKKAPDLMVYLRGSFDTVMHRIGLRGRDFEQDRALVDYYHTLWQGYDEWIEHHYHASDVVIINMDELDVVSRESDRQTVVKLVTDKLNLSK